MFAILHDKQQKPFIINLNQIHSFFHGENGRLVITALNPITNNYEDKECMEWIADFIQFVNTARNGTSAIINHNFAKATTFKAVKPFG